MLAGEIVDTIAKRVRDIGNNAHPRAEVRDVFNRMQTAVNARQGYVLETTDVTLAPGQALYRIETVTPNLFTITDVEVDGRYLDRIPWRNLWKASARWLFDTRDPLSWSTIGRSLLVVYPVPAQPRIVHATGPKITRLLVDDNTPVDLRDEDIDIPIDLATAYFLLKNRDIEASQLLTLRAADRLGLQQESEGEEMRIQAI